MTKYKCLKSGWMPLKDFCEKYGVDRGNTQRLMEKKLAESYKEQIGGKGKPWIIKEEKLLEILPNREWVEMKVNMKTIEKVEENFNECKKAIKIIIEDYAFEKENSELSDEEKESFINLLQDEKNRIEEIEIQVKLLFNLIRYTEISEKEVSELKYSIALIKDRIVDGKDIEHITI